MAKWKLWTIILQVIVNTATVTEVEKEVMEEEKKEEIKKKKWCT